MGLVSSFKFSVSSFLILFLDAVVYSSIKILSRRYCWYSVNTDWPGSIP